MIKIDWLKDINTGREIAYMNISNVLSAIRFSLVPLLIVMVGLMSVTQGHFIFRISIFFFAVLVCLTDSVDGIFARRFNEVTKLGMILDPFGDYLMILCFSTLIFLDKIITWWFYALIIIRIPGLVIGALIMMSLKQKIKLRTTLLSKATVFYILGQLGVSSIKLLLDLKIYYYDLFLLLTQIVGAVLIAISSGEKIMDLVQIIKDQKKMLKSEENIQI